MMHNRLADRALEELGLTVADLSVANRWYPMISGPVPDDVLIVDSSPWLVESADNASERRHLTME